MTVTRHEVTATMVGATPTLHPDRASITLDEAWSPYVRATLQCPIPSGFTNEIDPRENDRVTIVVTRTDVTTSAVQTRTFDLGLRGRTIDYVNGTMTMDLAGDEARLQDFVRYQNVDATLTPPVTTSLYQLVSWGLNKAIPGAFLQGGGSDATIDPAKIVFKLGDPMWGLLDPFVRGAGLRLWCDEARKWRLTTPLTGTGANNNLPVTMLEQTFTREPWADAVVIENTWTDAAGDIWTTAASAYTAAAGGPTKGFILRNAASTPPTTAAATALYYRMQGRGQDITMKLVSDYTLTPGVMVNTSSPGSGPAYSAMLAAVTWDFPADEMTLTTRDRPLGLRSGDDVLTCLDTTYTPNPTDPPVTTGQEP